ncbi:TauD/TfdA family dioxygenase [Hyphomicrobiales bacterium]|nr:TauD/TfdA family dioxygenase [Hyphomicrobiales bacterium]MDA9034366.1 TauD/TfdA family dioxygenase [Hyphomicrobiales bacterium]MDA9904534.1 TauD/TfdA family dioxygenase [Hyphomicrobiales bacterium]MDB4247259.1 TauD/TfdA family dioxygenase [Hyphomicrobiales bacterium]|tara:strand:- start:52 stop:915 length:864 start_codon:yes stop_codon:yes gene_type:complete
MNNKIMGYKIINNKSSLGVEVLNFEYNDISSKQKVNDLRDLWLAYSVIVFKNLKLTHEEFENFSLAFGVFGDDPYIDSISGYKNIIEVKRSAEEKAPPFGGSWHSDWSFQECPPSATLLHSKIIPPIGGETFFIDTQAAYDDLSSKIKLKIKDLMVSHSAIRPYADDGFYALEKDKDRSMAIKPSAKAKEFFLHPLVRTHPETKKKSLFINQVYSITVNGLNEKDSNELLEFLFFHMGQEKYIYKHKWEKNMLIMWDNRTVNHCAQGGYQGHKRLLHRITLAGSRPF